MPNLAIECRVASCPSCGTDHFHGTDVLALKCHWCGATFETTKQDDRIAKAHHIDDLSKEDQLVALRRICNRIFLCRSVSLNHDGVVTELGKIDRLFATPPEE